MMQLWVRRARALRALAPYNRSICGSPVFRSSSRSRACRDHHVGGGARAVVHRGRMQTAFEYSSQAGAAAALRGPVGLGSPQTAPRSRLSAFVLTFRFNVARSCLRHAAAAASRIRKDSPLTCENIKKAGIPGRCRRRPKHKIPTKTHKRSLAWNHRTRGQGRGRTADLPLFSSSVGFLWWPSPGRGLVGKLWTSW